MIGHRSRLPEPGVNAQRAEQFWKVSLRRKQLHVNGADYCGDRDRLVKIAYCIDVGTRLERSLAVFELHRLALE